MQLKKFSCIVKLGLTDLTDNAVIPQVKRRSAVEVSNCFWSIIMPNPFDELMKPDLVPLCVYTGYLAIIGTYQGELDQAWSTFDSYRLYTVYDYIYTQKKAYLVPISLYNYPWHSEYVIGIRVLSASQVAGVVGGGLRSVHCVPLVHCPLRRWRRPQCNEDVHIIAIISFSCFRVAAYSRLALDYHASVIGSRIK